MRVRIRASAARRVAHQAFFGSVPDVIVGHAGQCGAVHAPGIGEYDVRTSLGGGHGSDYSTGGIHTTTRAGPL